MPTRISNFQISQGDEVLDLYSLISKNGFLPVEQPLKRLPDSYYEQWERIMDELPTLLKAKTIRNRVDNLEILTTARLNTESEWQRAYVILCFLTHSYIWGGDIPSEARILTSHKVFKSDIFTGHTTLNHDPPTSSLRSSRPSTSGNLRSS